jgi:hypothetical protein
VEPSMKRRRPARRSVSSALYFHSQSRSISAIDSMTMSAPPLE